MDEQNENYQSDATRAGLEGIFSYLILASNLLSFNINIKNWRFSNQKMAGKTFLIA